MFRLAVKSLLPLAALALTQCMTESPRESSHGTAFAARKQSQHRFNPSQYSLMSKGDLDGNGSKDLFYVNLDGMVHIKKGNKSNRAPFTDNNDVILAPGAFGTLRTGNYLVGDHNGDGHADLYFIGEGGDLHVKLAVFAERWELRDQLDIRGTHQDNWLNGKYLAGDINGDGWTDLYFIYTGGGLAIYTNNKAGGFDRHVAYGDGDFGNWSTGKYYVGNYNGDSKSDLFFIGNAGDVNVRISKDGSHEALHIELLRAGAFGTQGTGQYHLADIDGDNDADLLFIGTSGDVHARLNTYGDLADYRKLLNAGEFRFIDLGQYYVGDWNGDGRSDLFFIGNTGYVMVRLSDGIRLPTQLNLISAGPYGNLDAGNYN
jgi:FG-GAP-like repeat